PQMRLYSKDEAARVWHVRESALGATVFVPGQPMRWEGWEDSAVPVDQLGGYLRDLFQGCIRMATALRSMAISGRVVSTCDTTSIWKAKPGSRNIGAFSIKQQTLCWRTA